MLAAHDPPTLIVSMSRSPATKSGLKDSAQNIKDTREFCVSIISEAWLEAANYAAVDAPPDVSEWTLTGLTPRKADTVSVPFVAEAGVSFECELDRAESLKNDEGVTTHTIIFGRIRKAHVVSSSVPFMEWSRPNPARLPPAGCLVSGSLADGQSQICMWQFGLSGLQHCARSQSCGNGRSYNCPAHLLVAQFGLASLQSNGATFRPSVRLTELTNSAEGICPGS